MKKLIILTLALYFASFIILGDNPKITVDSPSFNDVWYKGSKYKISWYINHSIEADVKIRLYSTDGNTKIKDISDGTDIDENFEWTIPDDITENCYIIRVKTIDNKYFDDSSVFSIKNKKIVKIIKAHLKPLKPDICISNIFKDKDCKIWITVKNTGKIMFNHKVREKIWVNGGPLLSQEETHYILNPGQEFSHEISGLTAKFFGSTIKIVLEPSTPLNEITKSNNTLEKTLKCIRVIKDLRKR